MTTTSRRWTAALTVLAATVACWLTPGVAAAQPTDAGGIHTYAPTPGDIASDRFGLSVDGTEVFVAKYANRSNNRMHVARFASADTVRLRRSADPAPTVTITNSAPITSWTIYPERLYPTDAVTVSGSSMTFEMSDALRYAIVRVNGTDPGLALINDPPEDPSEVPDPEAANVVNVADHVTDLTGASDQSVGIAAAIDELYTDESKDTLYFPDGQYQYAGLELRGRTKPVTIYLDEGALLKNRIQPTMTAMEPAIGIWDSANITVSGRGVFDGNGFANYDTANGGWRHDAKNSHHQGGAMIVRSHGIVFNDTLLRDAKQWNWETHTATDVTFNNIKGLTPFAQPWIDGLDFASGQNLTVNGALTLGNDDTFASGHYNPDDGFADDVLNPDRLNWDTADSANIVINDHLGWSAGGGNGIRLGHAAYGHAMKDYTFTNVHYLGFSGGNHGITVQNSPDVGVRNYPRYESLKITSSSFDTAKVQNNFAILGKSSSDPADRIGQVTLDDVWFSHERPSRIENVTDLTIADLTVAGQKVTRLTQTALTLTNVVNRTLDFPEDTAPVIEAIPAQNVNVVEGLEFSVRASDADGDTLTLAVGDPGLPVGAHFDSSTGVFTWTPSACDAGTSTVVFVVTDTHGVTATASVTITVTDPLAESIEVIAAADTNVATWNAEERLNYGDNEHLRVLNFNNAARGPLGELYAGGQSNQDAKLALLSFDLSDVTDEVVDADIGSAKMSLTYFGPTKGALTGTNTLQVARAATGWLEGNGKSTPTSRVNSLAGAATWLTKPTVDTSTVLESAPFDVTSAKVGADSTYLAGQRPVGSTAIVDVTAFVTAALEQGQDLSLAVNETKKQDIIFVSREGAERNPAALGMAPTLTVTLRHNATTDLTQLCHALEESAVVQEADHSAQTWSPFAQARAAAQDVITSPLPTQADVDRATQELRDAQTALQPALTAIAVTVARPAYAVGDQLDPAQVTVTATYSDGTTGRLPADDWQTPGLDTSTPGERTLVVVSRDGLTATGAPPLHASTTVTVLPAWDPDETYVVGTRVLFNTTIWEATWWTRGQVPGDHPYGPWQEMQTTGDGIAVWTASRIFVAGEIAMHDGTLYVARWWTRNQVPGGANGPWTLAG